MQAPPPPRRSAAGPLFAIGAAAVIALSVVHVAAGPNASDDTPTRQLAAGAKPRVLRGPEAPAGPVAKQADPRQLARARVFARDWLDFLGGRRAVAAVRGASPDLKLTFAGGAPPALKVSGADLRSVTCAPETPRGRACTATAARLGRFRFAMTPADGGGLEVSAVELD